VKYNIPTDWQEESDEWACYQIRWPLSDDWTRILLGVLSSLSHGRVWAENSGTIATAQEVGREIFKRNAGLPLCAPLPESEGARYIWEYDLADESEEIDDMTCLSCVIRINNGVLQVKDSGCEGWTDVGVVVGPGSSTEIPQDIHETQENPTPDYYTCGKAWGVVEIVFKVIDAMWDQIDEYPVYWVHNVSSAVGNVDLDNEYVWGGVFEAIAINALNGENPATDQQFRQDVLCHWEPLMPEGNARLYNDTVSAMIGALQGLFLQYSPGAILMANNAVLALDRALLSNAALANATDDSHDCDCHPAQYGELNPPEEGMDWLYVFDFTESDHGFDAAPSSGAWSFGVGWEGGTYFDHGSRLIISKDGMAGRTYTSKYIGVIYSYHPGDNSAEGESDTITAHSTLLSIANITLVEGDTSTYEREADVAIVQDTINSLALDFSDVDTDDLMIRVSKIIWAGTGDNPFS
jgi:hypothetical protein